MLLVLAGSILTFTMVQEATVVEPFEKGQIVIEQDVDSSPVELRSDVRVEPLVEQKFRNIVRGADHGAELLSRTDLVRTTGHGGAAPLRRK